MVGLRIFAYPLGTAHGSLPNPRTMSDRATLLDYYEWDFELDTLILNNPLNFLDWFHSLFEDIYWSFGFINMDKDVLKEFLEKEFGMTFN